MFMEQWLRSLLLLFAVSDLCGYAILNVPKLSFHSRLAAAEARKTSTRVHVTNDGDFQDRDESDERTIYGDNPCVIVVDPMDVNGRRFCEGLQEWGVEVIPVLSPAVAERISEDADGESLAHLAAPKPGEEIVWAAERGLIPGLNPPLASLSESDAGIETALRLEIELGCVFGNSVRFGTASADSAAEVSSYVERLKEAADTSALRQKDQMIERVRCAGLRAPRQVAASRWAEAEAFLVQELGILDVSREVSEVNNVNEGTEDITLATSEGNTGNVDCPVAILKPARGAASMDVVAVGSGATGLSAAREAFEAIHGAPSHEGGGAINQVVLVQEYLGGTEYAVDTVSLAPVINLEQDSDGGGDDDDEDNRYGGNIKDNTVRKKTRHKVLAVWRYDKRAVNGQKAPVVYFSTQLQTAAALCVPSSTLPTTKSMINLSKDVDELEKARLVADYVVRVLDAVGLRDGPAHTEVKWATILPKSGRQGGTIYRAAGNVEQETKDGAVTENMLEPCIIEVNARWHACNFQPVVDECVGCNAIEATVLAILSRHDALLRARAQYEGKDSKTHGYSGFSQLTDAANAVWEEISERVWEGPLAATTSAASSEARPLVKADIDTPHHSIDGKCGRVVHLVSFVRGTLIRVDPQQLKFIEALSSVKAVELSVGPGSWLEPTRDISATDCGQVRMIHGDPRVLESDYNALVNTMPYLFEVR